MTDRALYVFAERLSALEGRLNDRTPQLAYSTLEGGAITVTDEFDALRGAIGQQFDGSGGYAEFNGPTPLQPTPADLTGGAGSLNVRWDGLWAAGPTTPTPMNFTRVEVHISTTSGFLADTADTLFGTIESPRGGELSFNLPPATYYVRLVARNLSGAKGPASVEVSAAAGPILGEAELEAIQTDVDTALATANAAATQTAFDALVTDLDTNYFTKTETATEISVVAATKNKVVYSTSDPSGTNYTAGDIWRKVDTLATGGKIIGEWTFVMPGAAWVTRAYSGLILTALDAGTITSGFLSSARIEAGSLTIGQVNNLQTTLNGKEAAGAAAAAQSAAISYADTTYGGTKTRVDAWTFTGQTTIDGGQIQADTIQAVAVKAGIIGAQHLIVGDLSNMSQLDETVPGTVTYGGYTTAIYESPSGRRWVYRNPATASPYFMFRNQRGPIPFKTGDRIRVALDAFTLSADIAVPPLNFWAYPPSGTPVLTWSLTKMSGPANITSTTATFVWEGVVPAGFETSNSDKYLFGFGSALGSNDTRVRNVRAYVMNAGELIVDGSIIADKLAVDSVTAVKIKAGEVTAGKLAALSVIAGNIAANAVTASTIAAGAIEAGKLAAGAVVAGNVAAGAVTADLIGTGELQATVRIIAGPELGSHAELTSAGLKVFRLDPEVGVYLVGSLGDSSADDSLSFYDATGAPTAVVSADGSASFLTISSEMDAQIAGFPLLGTSSEWHAPADSDGFVQGHFDNFPRGLVGWGSRNTNSNTLTAGTEGKYLEAQASVRPYRNYRIRATNINVLTGTANGRMLLRLRLTTDGTAVSTSSTAIAFRRVVTPLASVSFGAPDLEYILTVGGPLVGEDEIDLRVLLTYVPEGASGQIYPDGAPVLLTIEDIGPRQIERGIDHSNPTPPSSKKRYTSTWYANDSEAYGLMSGGSYTARTDTTDLTQGYYSGNQGNQFSKAVMSGNAIYGETTRTIASALSGATIEKVEAYIYPKKFPTRPSNSGTVVVRPHNSTSLSSTTPSGSSKSQGMVAGTGEWVDITSIATSSIRGFSIGPGASTGAEYYGYFSPHNDTTSRRPKLRIQYTR